MYSSESLKFRMSSIPKPPSCLSSIGMSMLASGAATGSKG